MRPWLLVASVAVLAVAPLGVWWVVRTDRDAAEAQLELRKLELEKLDAERRALELRRDLEHFEPEHPRMGDFPPWYGKGPQPALLPSDSMSTTPGAQQFKLGK